MARTLGPATTTPNARTFVAASQQYMQANTGFGLGANEACYIVARARRNDATTNRVIAGLFTGIDSANNRRLGFGAVDTVSATAFDSTGTPTWAEAPWVISSDYQSLIASFPSAASRTIIVNGTTTVVSTDTRTVSVAPSYVFVGGLGTFNSTGADIAHVAIFKGTPTDELIRLHALGVHPTQLPGHLLECWDLNATGNITGANGTVLTAFNGGTTAVGPSAITNVQEALVSPARSLVATKTQYLSGTLTGLGIGANDPVTIVTRTRRNSTSDNVTFASINYSASRADSRRLWAVSNELYASDIDAAYTQSNSNLSYGSVSGWKVLAAAFSPTWRQVSVDGVKSTPATTTITHTNAPTLIYVGVAALADTSYPLDGAQSHVLLIDGLVSDSTLAAIMEGMPIESIPNLLEGWYLNATGNITGVNGTVLTAVNGGTLVEGPVTSRTVRQRSIAADVWAAASRTLTSTGGGIASRVMAHLRRFR